MSELQDLCRRFFFHQHSRLFSSTFNAGDFFSSAFNASLHRLTFGLKFKQVNKYVGFKPQLRFFTYLCTFFTENLLNFREKWFLVQINEIKPHAIKPMLWNKKRFYNCYYNIFGNDSKQWGKSICLKWKHLFIFCIQYKFH